MIRPGPAVLLGEAFRVFCQAFRPFRGEDFQEVGPTDLRTRIDEALEFRDSADAHMPFEVNPVETRQRPGNQAGKLGEEGAYSVYGIRFLNDCRLQSFWTAGCLFSSSWGGGRSLR